MKNQLMSSGSVSNDGGRSQQGNLVRSRLLFAFACLLVLLMPSGESLWIDEGVEALYASRDSISDWYDLLVSDNKSNTQMPAAMLFRWGWAQLTGSSEWALRSANVLWTLIGLWMFMRVAKRESVPVLPVVFLLHPFVWFYANEARPYSMIIASGAILLDAMSVLRQAGRSGVPPDWRAICLMVFGVLLAAYSAILSLFLLVFFLPWVGWTWWRARLPLKKLTWIGVALVLLLVPCALYYLETIVSDDGGKKSTIVSIGLPGIAFALYEFLGFSGLGPPRDEIRSGVIEAGVPGALQVVMPSLPWLALFALALGATGIFGWRTVGPDGRRSILVVGCFGVLLPAGLLIVAAMVKGASFWGRHLAILLPFFLYAFSALLQAVSLKKGAERIVVYLSVLLLLGISSFRQRLNPAFEKADYRSASVEALETLEAGGVVWWAADAPTAYYYDVPIKPKLLLSEGETMEQVPNIHFLHNPGREQLATLAKPDLVVLGKRDLYDPRMNIREQVKSHGLEPTRSRAHGFSFFHSDLP